MSRIRPVDLERPNLKTSFRGYDREQVDALLRDAANEMGAILTESKDSKEECERLRSEIERFRAQENTLKEALMLAQKTADETRAAAHKEADLILDQAKQQINTLVQQSQERINDLRWETERLRLEKQKFVNSFRSMLESHLRELTESTAPGFAVVEGAVTVQTEEESNTSSA